MVSVAQKTLFFKNLVIFGIFLSTIQVSFAKADINIAEKLTYKVTLNGMTLGDAVLSYEPTDDKNYKIVAKANTKGLASKIYSINNTILVNGYIKDNKLEPMNQTSSLNQFGKKVNKSVNFDYKNDLLKVTHHNSSESWFFPLIEDSKDIFSELYSLRFNTDVEKITQSTTINKYVQFSNKTMKSEIMISAPFNFNISKNKTIQAHNVVVGSKRLKYQDLKEPEVALIKQGKLKPKEYLKLLEEDKKFKAEKNIRVIVSSDENKIPLVIYYSTKYGTFKAVLKDYKKI